jgi:hypothetical protein
MGVPVYIEEYVEEGNLIKPEFGNAPNPAYSIVSFLSYFAFVFC